MYPPSVAHSTTWATYPATPTLSKLQCAEDHYQLVRVDDSQSLAQDSRQFPTLLSRHSINKSVDSRIPKD